MPKTITGIVQQGLGQGAAFTQRAWVRRQCRAKLGFDPYPGTLNVRVRDAAALAGWHALPSIPIDPAPGFCAARCRRVLLNDAVAAVWLIPDVPNYPNDLMELLAPNCLRDVLGVESGGVVKIQIGEE